MITSGPSRQTEDCVECNVFGRGVCLAEFRAFDACFERAQASGGSSSAEEACMDKVGREGGLDQ
jgi:hypothetical protein